MSNDDMEHTAAGGAMATALKQAREAGVFTAPDSDSYQLKEPDKFKKEADVFVANSTSLLASDKAILADSHLLIAEQNVIVNNDKLAIAQATYGVALGSFTHDTAYAQQFNGYLTHNKNELASDNADLSKEKSKEHQARKDYSDDIKIENNQIRGIADFVLHTGSESLSNADKTGILRNLESIPTGNAKAIVESEAAKIDKNIAVMLGVPGVSQTEAAKDEGRPAIMVANVDNPSDLKSPSSGGAKITQGQAQGRH